MADRPAVLVHGELAAAAGAQLGAGGAAGTEGSDARTGRGGSGA
ncbi:hypothetical protein [Streptomyces sp. NRRL F-5755]|nr:hypothetical protein [Streptomyces sp. NRRL F-5755]